MKVPQLSLSHCNYVFHASRVVQSITLSNTNMDPENGTLKDGFALQTSSPQIVMASNLLATASNILAMASNLLAVPSNLLAMSFINLN